MKQTKENTIKVNQLDQEFELAEEQAKAFCQKRSQLQRELCAANTQENFDKIAREVIQLGIDVNHFLSNLKQGTEPKIISALIHNSKHVGLLLKSTGDLIENQDAQNESILLQQKLIEVTEEQKNKVHHFIQGIKQLQPIAAMLMSQEDDFVTRLKEADSIDAVNQLEAEIMDKNTILEGALTRLVTYPQDEVVAGVLVDFLSRNTSLLDIMQSFDLHASLMDDLSNAKESFTANRKLP